ncbi:hypothetical protein ACQ4PT_041704 [Festuca glaucescens]
METFQLSSDDLSAAAGDYPPWVIFAEQKRRYRHKEDQCPSPADPRTVAHARTSTGHLVRVFFRCAAPPAVLCLDLNVDDGLLDGVDIIFSVVVAHGDSVLIHMMLHKEYEINTTDYFVYNAGDGARPPSLSLLLPCYMDEERFHHRRYQVTMSRKGTGILRRGDEELVVMTDLTMNIIACDDDGGAKQVEAEVRVLRSGEWQWKAERLTVRHDVNKGEVISYCWWWVWETDWTCSNPVGDRFLYWADLHQGIVFSDVSEESPDLRFVPLPVEPILRRRENWDRPESCRSFGCHGRRCHGQVRPRLTLLLLRRPRRHQLRAFSLRLHRHHLDPEDEDDAGRRHGVGDGRRGRLRRPLSPRRLPTSPSSAHGFPRRKHLDDANVVCLLVSEHNHLGHRNGDKTTWVVIVDTTTKTLLRSVILYSEDKYYHGEALLPSQVSSYFNTPPGPGSSKHSVPPASGKRCRENILDVWPAANCLPSPDEEILAALQEVPGLTRDEMLKAYDVFACDDRRRYSSLVVLPVNRRKDYCCMLVDMGTSRCS